MKKMLSGVILFSVTLLAAAVSPATADENGGTGNAAIEHWVDIQSAVPEEVVIDDLEVQAARADEPVARVAAANVNEFQSAAVTVSPRAVAVDADPDEMPTSDDYGSSDSSDSGGGNGDRVPLPRAKRPSDMFYYPSYTWGLNHGHIGMYRWRGIIIEAANETLGVRRIKFAERPPVPKGETYLLANYVSDKSERLAAAAWLPQHVGDDYRSPTSPNRTTSAPFNCSQLVWAAWKHAGFEVDENEGTYVLPQDIVQDSDHIGYYKKL